MWRPDRGTVHQRVATPGDIPGLNRVFSEAFTERYRRDGLAGVRVPPLNPAVWAFAIRDAGEGAMLWHDERGELVAFNIAHRSGLEGWMGPLAVRTDRQGHGIGRRIVSEAVQWLKAEGAATIGLETMPRTVDNIDFYSRLGFRPRHLTVTMVGAATRRRGATGVIRASRLAPAERSELFIRCRDRVRAVVAGPDYTREAELSIEMSLGDMCIVDRGGGPAGFALWHVTPLAEGRGGDELRVLKLFAESRDAFEHVLDAVEAAAAGARLQRVAVRCQTDDEAAYAALIERGYRVRWTDLRMTLTDHPEPRPADPATVFSNWEI